QQTLQALLAVCAVAAVVAPLLGLIGNEPRRVIALAGSGVAAIAAAVVISGFRNQSTTFAVAGVACVLAMAPARAAAWFAISSIANAMRTDDLAEMGDAWRRMRARSTAVLGSAVVLGLTATAGRASGGTSGSQTG